MSTSSTAFSVLGKTGAVYPGHPLTLAYLIMLTFPSYSEAKGREEGSDYGRALTSSEIPGAGGNVHGALDLLKRVRTVGIDEAIKHGTEYWTSCTSGSNFPARRAPGQEQADSIEAKFRETAANWNFDGAGAAA